VILRKVATEITPFATQRCQEKPYFFLALSLSFSLALPPYSPPMHTTFSRASRPVVLFVSVLGLAALLVGCSVSGPRTANAGLLNDRCPMQPACNQALETTVDYKGGKVGFCCGGCLAEWNALDDAQRAERFAAVKR
jgi:hypothetical protein